MQKRWIFGVLFVLFATYSAFVYTIGTQGSSLIMNQEAVAGKMVFQKYNCSACHQIYGLGGYLGPELTTLMSQKNKDVLYVDAIMKSGTVTMPNFHLNEDERLALIAYFKYIDTTAITYKN